MTFVISSVEISHFRADGARQGDVFIAELQRQHMTRRATFFPNIGSPVARGHSGATGMPVTGQSRPASSITCDKVCVVEIPNGDCLSVLAAGKRPTIPASLVCCPSIRIDHNPLGIRAAGPAGHEGATAN